MLKAKVKSLAEALEILNKYKIPLADFAVVKNVEQAIKAARKIKYPIVLKLISKDVIHKTDVGAIQLGIKSDTELLKYYNQILNNVRRKHTKAKIDGMLVQKMVPNGQEVIVGSKHDEQFGKVMMFGLGGIFTEVFNDVSFRVTPISKTDAEAMIKEIIGYKILQGYRGKKYDIKALIKILLKISKLLEENPRIKEIDINPVIVSSSGAVAVDTRIILA